MAEDDETNPFLWMGIIASYSSTDVDIDAEEDHTAQEENNDDQSAEQNALSVKSFVKDKVIESYAKDAVEKMKAYLKAHEPLMLGSIDRETIKDANANVGFQLKNIKLFNLSTLQTKKLKSVSNDESLEFAFFVPSVRANADYDLNGTALSTKIEGKGNADINVTDVSITNGLVKIKETPQEIQVTTLNLLYDFKNLMVKQTGLSIEGKNPDEVTKFLNDAGNKYLKDYRQKISSRLSMELKNKINQALKGKSRDELMEMSKKALK